MCGNHTNIICLCLGKGRHLLLKLKISFLNKPVWRRILSEPGFENLFCRKNEAADQGHPAGCFGCCGILRAAGQGEERHFRVGEMPVCLADWCSLPNLQPLLWEMNKPASFPGYVITHLLPMLPTSKGSFLFLS